MKRTATIAALAMIIAGPLATTSADAFFTKASGKTASAAAAADAAKPLGLRADQLRVGSKRWFEQMEREGRLGGPRG